MAKRGRGHPKTTVAPSPANLTTPVSQPVGNTDEGNKPLEAEKKDGESEHLETAPDSRKLWVDVLIENRNPNKGMQMAYVTQTSNEGDFDIEIEEKYFLLRFKNHDDLDNVMMKGLYTLRNIPIILKKWRPGYNVKEDLLRTIPIWVKLHMLPFPLWGACSLNKIGSKIGVPMVTDECKTHKLRVSYARILVEVDITRKLIDELIIKDLEGKKLKRPIEYEWRPKFCEKCQKMGQQCGVDM
ncbi:uncharacterized protein LOC131629334 [Vicia villosa]|uniref:uncharacterized protein LOC131629334 n=1 Tax=Vicia villosa TaxID=3911 RepID=UPI00273BDBEC|nr:uncharacterized protein LOC131629334 [Vicia villosa]